MVDKWALAWWNEFDPALFVHIFVMQIRPLLGRLWDASFWFSAFKQRFLVPHHGRPRDDGFLDFVDLDEIRGATRGLALFRKTAKLRI